MAPKFAYGQPISANTLRWFAEHADGFRDEDMVLIREVGSKGPPKVQIVQKTAVPDGWEIIVELNTKFRGEGGLRLPIGPKGKVMLAVKYKNEYIDLPQADAVFLSQSAVEKFVFPYYMRFKSANSVSNLETTLYSPDVIAVEHIPPSIMDDVTAGDSSMVFSVRGLKGESKTSTDFISAV